jgi:hypothetical protein
VHGEVGADGVADNDENMLWMLKEAIMCDARGAAAASEHLELQGAQCLGLVAALLCQREQVMACDRSGGVAQVADDGHGVVAARGACVQRVSLCGHCGGAWLHTCAASGGKGLVVVDNARVAGEDDEVDATARASTRE